MAGPAYPPKRAGSLAFRSTPVLPLQGGQAGKTQLTQSRPWLIAADRLGVHSRCSLHTRAVTNL
jgi:hypothetical protein